MSGMFGAEIGSGIYLVESPAANSSRGVRSPSAKANWPRAGLLSSTAILGALIMLAIPDRAAAQTNDACGPLDATGSVTCVPADNPYPDGIGYATPPVTPGGDVTLPDTPVVDLSVVLDPGVFIVPADPATPRGAIRLQGHNSGSVTLVSGPDSAVVTTGDNQNGVSATAQAGNIVLGTPRIFTYGQGSSGIDARTTGGGSIDIAASDTYTYGDRARGISAQAGGGGDVTLSSLGNVATYGAYAAGVRGVTTAGTASIDVVNVHTQGYASDAVVAGGNNAAVDVSGAVSTAGDRSYGVFARGDDGWAGVTLSGTVETLGFASNGVDVAALGDASVIGTGSVETHGTLARGVAVSSQYGDAVIDLATVRTHGDSASAISASAVAGNARVTVGSVSTARDYSNAIQAFSTYGDVSVTATGEVSTQGFSSTAISARSRRLTDVSVDTVSVAGDDSSAIVATGDEVNVTITGTVSTAGASNQSGAGLYQSTVFAGAAVNPANLDALARSGIATVLNNGSVTSSGYNTAGIIAMGERGVVIVGTGSVATSGDEAVGIRAVASGDIAIDMGAISIAGLSTRGIDALSTGDITVHADTVTTTGDRTVALFLTSQPQVGLARITVDVDSLETSGTRSWGVDAYSQSDLELSFAGSIRTTGDYGLGIAALAVNTNVMVTGSIATSGKDANGVYATAEEHVRVTHEGTIAVSGAASSGIIASGSGEVQVVSRGSVSSTGGLGAAISANTFDGNVLVDAAAVEAHGVFGKALRATTASGDVKVTVASATALGFNATGVDARSMDGNVWVASTGRIDATGYGALAISAESTGRTVVEVNDITVSGQVTRAIHAVGGDVDITLNGAIRSDAFSVSRPIATVAASTMVYDPFAGSQGIITIVNNGTVESDGHNMLAIHAFAASDVSISGPGSVRTGGDFANAITAHSASGSVDVAMESIATTGAVARGVHLTAQGNGSVAVGSVTTRGASAPGIDVRVGGTATVTGGLIRTSGDNAPGILVRGLGDVGVAFDSVDTSGANATGIRVQVTGAIDVSLTNGSTAGPGSELIDIGSGEGDVRASSTGLLSVSGAGSTLIDAQSYLSVRVEVNNATVAGDGSRGIVAIAGNDATVTVNGAFTGSAAQAAANSAMIAVSGYATATLVNHGTISTSGANQAAVDVRGYAGATISGTGSIATTGDGARGVYAGANTVGASVRQASVSTRGADAAAIVARSYGVTLVDVGGASTAGDRSVAIFAEGGDSVTVHAGAVSTAGTASDGIVARSYGASTVVAGSVTATGTGSYGIIATSLYAGDAGVTATGPVVTNGAGVVAVSGGGAANVRVASVTSLGADFNAVVAHGATTANMSIDAGGIVSARGDSVILSSGDGSSLSNAGTLLAGDGAAVRALGGSATILNTGTLIGAVILTANADTVTNSGTMALGGGTSFGAGDDRLTNSGALWLGGDLDFGAGNDSFVNSGTLGFAMAATSGVQLLSALAPQPQTRTLAGLESFANSGLIDLRSGVAGDVLTSDGAFVGSGGSTLAIDADPTIADRLVVAGAATGSTRIVVNPLAGETTPLQPGIIVVQAGTGTSANAFSIDPGSRFRGFVELGLVYRANAFALVATPAPTAYRLIKLGEGAQTLWLDSADAVSSHLTSLRDATEPARGLWVELSGGMATREDTRSIDNFGFVQTVDLGYRQDGFGGQLGIDLGGDGFTFGATGGYRSSVMHFAAGGDRATFDAFNGGVYAQLRRGDLFVNALAKYDRYEVRTSLPSIGASDRFGGSGYGGRIEAGYRLGSERFYAEPSVGLSYTRTELGSTGAFGARVDFAERDGLRGTAGLRLGSRSEIGGGNELTIYASAQAVREFAGEDGIAFTTGATTLGFSDRRLGVYGAGRLGASIRSGRVTGFIEAEGRYSDEYRGGGGRAGLRIGF